jgi:hypothetical protein
MKSIAGISLAALLVCGSALAQAPSEKVAPGTDPAVKSGEMKNPGMGTDTKSPVPRSSADTTAPSKTPSGNLAMNADDRLASRLIGATIRNANNESIGDIADLVVDRQGQIRGVIAGIGGFLGIGETRVLVGYDQLQFSKDASGRMVVQSQFTRDQLANMPAWRDPDAASTSTK